MAGVNDPHQGEAVKAWVVLCRDQQCTDEELREFCRDKLAAYKVPRHIEFSDSLPSTAAGF